MEAVVPRNLAKTFTKAVVCLAKCGDELFVEADEERLLLRTVNSAKSAFLAFSFLTGFFERYELTERVERCKVLSKPLLSTFKTAVNAESILFSVNAQGEPRIVVLVTTKSGVVKRARLHYEDAEALQAVYSRESCTATVVSRPRLLAESLAAFQKESEELTFTLRRNALKVRSYLDPARSQQVVAAGAAGPAKAMQTELSIDARDFQEFGAPAAPLDAEVIFNVKELRAMLRFCEEAGHDIAMRAEGPGRPVLFSAHTNGPAYFEADLVVATLADAAPPSAPTSPAPPRPASQPALTPPQPSSPRAASSRSSGPASMPTATPPPAPLKAQPAAAPTTTRRRRTRSAPGPALRIRSPSAGAGRHASAGAAQLQPSAGERSVAGGSEPPSVGVRSSAGAGRQPPGQDFEFSNPKRPRW
eukprot:tig00001590_g9379.t1